MGGCCCHNDDAKEESVEEKCIIVDNEEPEPASRDYGSLSTVEDKSELKYEEKPQANRNIKQSPSKEEITQYKELSDEYSSSSDVSHSSISPQHASESQLAEQEVAENPNEGVTAVTVAGDDMSQGDVDREIDQLVAVAMAAKVIYPPSATQEEESSFCTSPSPASGNEPSSLPTHDQSDQDEGSDEETSPNKGFSLMKRTQQSFKRAKARATSMVSIPSRNSSGEQVGKKKHSLQEKKSSHLEKKKFSMEERAPERDYKKPLYVKNSRESQTAPSKSGTRTAKRRTEFVAGEGMKSHYAKGRVAQYEVERDVREKIASHKAASDPRKAALERGERLGQLDDTIQDMRDHSSSFAQVARQLRDEQRGRTSTFPW
ncbi:uncharacterized protein LOC110985912 [Acanthaster planci]|uniref:Uncharacterized protein LOC110985912 n=1 Tax=Acanthaster planci TaxID=133434 RepID=A0A8B7ZBK8_ACAPL|nr:uncharacterized protein LOC110985912 [Acanthaster planci]